MKLPIALWWSLFVTTEWTKRIVAERIDQNPLENNFQNFDKNIAIAEQMFYNNQYPRDKV